MSIMHELRQATRADHQALELALGLANTDVSTPRYVRTLEKFYGYYDPLERRLPEISGLMDVIDDLSRRLKAPLLQRDLHYWGRNERALPQCRTLPRLDGLLDALGCLYVLEGATLGGRILTRHFQARLGISPDTGGAFFAGYGDQTGAMWHVFGNALDAVHLSKDESELIIECARATFRTLQTWCAENVE